MCGMLKQVMNRRCLREILVPCCLPPGRRTVARLVTGGDDGLPRVWDVASGKPLIVLRGHTHRVDDVDWSRNGERIASLSAQEATLKIWDAASGIFLFEIRGHNDGSLRLLP